MIYAFSLEKLSKNLSNLMPCKAPNSFNTNPNDGDTAEFIT